MHICTHHIDHIYAHPTVLGLETLGCRVGLLETLRRMWSRAVASLQLERTTEQPPAPPPNNPHIVRVTVNERIKMHTC